MAIDVAVSIDGDIVATTDAVGQGEWLLPVITWVGPDGSATSITHLSPVSSSTGIERGPCGHTQPATGSRIRATTLQSPTCLASGLQSALLRLISNRQYRVVQLRNESTGLCQGGDRRSLRG